MRRLLLLLLGLGIVIVGSAAALLVAFKSHPERLVGRLVTHITGMETSFGHLTFDQDQNIITADDIHIANRPWGTKPDLLHVGHLEVLFKWRMHETPHVIYEDVKIDDAELWLERNDKGLGNWKKGPSAPRSPEEEARRSRASFPALFNVALSHSRILFKTSSGDILKIALENCALKTDGLDRPVKLHVVGGYNDRPVTVDIKTASYQDLWDTSHAFPATIDANGKATHVALDLKLMDPINFDQFDGQIHVLSTSAGESAAYLGGATDWPKRLELEGNFARQGDDWDFSKMQGQLAGNVFTDSLFHLKEGKRLEPDFLTTDIGFERMTVESFQTQKNSGFKKPDGTKKAEYLDIGRHPGTLLDAKIKARSVGFGTMEATNFKIHALIAEGKAGIEEISFGLLGGNASGHVMTEPRGEDDHVDGAFTLAGIETEKLPISRQQKDPIITGPLTLHVEGETYGRDLNDLRQNLDGHFKMSMSHGTVKKWANKLIAGDVGSLFDSKIASVPVRCLTGSVDFKKGMGHTTDFLFAAGDQALDGVGTIDLMQDRLNLELQTDPSTTGWLATDPLIKISGQFPNLDVVPSLAGRIAMPTGTCAP